MSDGREERLESVISEAYSVIGQFAVMADLLGHPEVERALDYFSGGFRKTEADLIPWPADEAAFSVPQPPQPSITVEPSDEAVFLAHGDFKIGMEFVTATGAWRCTDVGTRTILAISLHDGHDESWRTGPPYAVSEVAFDENDIEGCWIDQAPKAG